LAFSKESCARKDWPRAVMVWWVRLSLRLPVARPSSAEMAITGSCDTTDDWSRPGVTGRKRKGDEKIRKKRDEKIRKKRRG
jgi:hypothetical protein